MKKILLISGSPRNGNTEYILNEILRGLGDKATAELLLLREADLSQCRGCLTCEKTGCCVINDDWRKIYGKIAAADIIVFGSPTYYGNVSGLAKIFIDRTLPLDWKKKLRNKKIILFLVGGDKEAELKNVLTDVLQRFISYQKLKLLGSFVFSAYEKDDARKDKKAAKKIREIIKLIN